MKGFEGSPATVFGCTFAAPGAARASAAACPRLVAAARRAGAARRAPRAQRAARRAARLDGGKRRTRECGAAARAPRPVQRLRARAPPALGGHSIPRLGVKFTLLCTTSIVNASGAREHCAARGVRVGHSLVGRSAPRHRPPDGEPCALWERREQVCMYEYEYAVHCVHWLLYSSMPRSSNKCCVCVCAEGVRASPTRYTVGSRWQRCTPHSPRSASTTWCSSAAAACGAPTAPAAVRLRFGTATTRSIAHASRSASGCSTPPPAPPPRATRPALGYLTPTSLDDSHLTLRSCFARIVMQSFAYPTHPT